MSSVVVDWAGFLHSPLSETQALPVLRLDQCRFSVRHPSLPPLGPQTDLNPAGW